MVESGLLASGSVNGFITGTHFNRCRRLYPIVSLAIQILHFQSFLEVSNIEIPDGIKERVNEIFQTSNINSLNQCEPLFLLMQDYSEYKKRTLAGEFGKTPQFYLILVKIIDYYLLLSRSIRTADFNLYKYVMPKISNIFFMSNQPNYSRWLLKYYDNLVKVEETHPGLQDELEKGCFGIKRTSKPFSRQPIDLVLEQTINADAG